MKITSEFIDQGRSGKGGWTKVQFELLGAAWPPKPGWKMRVIGTEISEADADKFLKSYKGYSKDKQASLFEM